MIDKIKINKYRLIIPLSTNFISKLINLASFILIYSFIADKLNYLKYFSEIFIIILTYMEASKL